MFDKILVPIDGSEHSRRALHVAHRLAAPDEATLYLLNVPEWPAAQDPLGKAVGARARDVPRETVEERARRFLERAEEAEQIGHGVIEQTKGTLGPMHVHIDTIVRQGSPADVILEEAGRAGVDAIVMGSRGVSDLEGLLLGSVSHKVLHAAPCAVILVR